MIKNLQALGLLLNIDSYLEQAVLSLLPMKGSIRKYPQSFAKWADAIFFQVYPAKEIAIVGNDYEAVALELQKKYLPHAIYSASKTAEKDIPLLKDRAAITDKTMIYVCSNFSCKLPVDNVDAAIKLLY